MMLLYKQYCYVDVNSVADSVRSDPTFSGFGLVNSVTTSLNHVTVNYTNSNNILKSYTFTPPACSQVGFDNSYSGITTSDAVYYGSSISLVFIIAWSIKVIKRAL